MKHTEDSRWVPLPALQTFHLCQFCDLHLESVILTVPLTGGLQQALPSVRCRVNSLIRLSIKSPGDLFPLDGTSNQATLLFSDSWGWVRLLDYPCSCLPPPGSCHGDRGCSLRMLPPSQAPSQCLISVTLQSIQLGATTLIASLNSVSLFCLFICFLFFL